MNLGAELQGRCRHALDDIAILESSQDSLAERSKAAAQGATPQRAWARTPQLSLPLPGRPTDQRAHARGAACVATAALLAPWAKRDTMIRPGAWAWPQTMSHEEFVPPLFRTRVSREVQRLGRACPVFAARQKVDTLGIEPRASRMLSGCDTTTPRAHDRQAAAAASTDSHLPRRACARTASACPSAGWEKQVSAKCHSSLSDMRPDNGQMARSAFVCGLLGMHGAAACSARRRAAGAAPLDTLGIEPRASRMLSGCDTTTPRAHANNNASRWHNIGSLAWRWAGGAATLRQATLRVCI